MFLVNSSPGSMTKSPTFRTGETIPQSGIYLVIHDKHRLPHEVTLLKDEEFPRCAKCQNAVTFQLLQAAEEMMDMASQHSFRVRLYELPADEAEEGTIGLASSRGEAPFQPGFQPK